MSTNIIANTSYTNKDFQDIYPELLDLAKALGSKWDPSISNESDPGVVLIKLNAIIADKLDYNIDKNVLECFPLSVTQESNARQLFEQLGYYMHWYKSATTTVSIKWIGDTTDSSYEIPAFTMVSDYDRSIVYTLIGPASGTTSTTFNVGSQTLLGSGKIITFKAIQGIATEYDINGETLITPAMLDSNNRLYFTDTNVAENGIFITNANENNYSSWIKKDNLLVEELGNSYYKFGVTQDSSTCYIEFPEDAESIIKDGIYITYMKTDGNSGNISARTLERFYDDFTVNDTTLTEDNTLIANYSSAANGEDTEDIDDAYKSYKKTIGTFNTLVTVRDYINAITTSGLVSNGFICDRTNDIQLTYKVMSTINDSIQDVTIIEQGEQTYDSYSTSMTYQVGAIVTYSGTNYVCIQAIEFPEVWTPSHWAVMSNSANANPKLSAFDLKLYLLQYMDSTDTIANYNASFDMLTPSDLSSIESYIGDIKSINHDFQSIETPTYNASQEITKAHFCYFKNKYPLKCTIIPQYVLTTTQANEVITNVKKALYNNLNSINVEFGSEIDFDTVHNIIVNADNRIKNISLNTINYVTYAVYWNGTSFVEVQINGDGVDLTDETVLEFRSEVYAKSVLAGVTPFFIKDEEYDYRLNQLANDEIENVEMIGTDLTVELSKVTSDSGATTTDNTVYTIGTNQSVQFYAPNLIDTTAYSNYVKFEYRLANSIAANASYQLRANEWIILYWKEEDTDDAVYKYYAYGEGNVFKSTFDITANGLTATLYGESLLTGKRNVGTTTLPCWESSSSYNGDMSSSLSTIIKDNLLTDNTLSGTKQLTKRIVNEVTLDNSYFCYWTLNSQTNDGKYRLFSIPEQYSSLNTYIVGDEVFYNDVPYKCTTEITVPETFTPSHWTQMLEQSRILSTGEYFFYSNQNLSDLVILGVGTEITRTIFNTNWEVTAGDSSTILEEGITALDSLWFTIPSSTTLGVVENQYVSLAEGYQLKMSTTNPKNIYNINYVINSESTVQSFTVSWTETDPLKYRDKWFTKTGGIVGNYPFTYTSGQWRTVGSQIVSLDDYGIQISVSAQEGMMFNIYVYDTWSVKYTSFSGMIITLPTGNLARCATATMADFSIMYKHSNDTEWITLEDISLITHNTWSTRSLLKVNTSSTQEQILLKDEAINYRIFNQTSYQQIDGANLTEGYIYVCNGTETGKYHFNVDSTNYSFTMPSSITAQDKIIFVASSKYLYLNYIGGTRITTTSGTQGTDITDSFVIINFYPSCILTSFECETEGGEYVYSYTYDDEGNKQYLDIYKYGKIINTSSNARYTDDGAAFDFNATTTEASIYFSLPNGTYVVPMEHLGLVELTNLQVKLDGVLLTDMSGTVSNFKNIGAYFLKMTLTNSPKIHELKIISNGQTISYSVTVGNFYKYTKPDNLTQAEFETMLALINSLNTNGANYSFSTQIDSDVVIEDPLDAEQFLNSNHIYNPYTICQLDTSSNTNIQVQGLK